MFDQLQLQRVKSVKGRAHARQNKGCEIAFAQARGQLAQTWIFLQAGERILEGTRLIKNVVKIFAFNHRQVNLHSLLLRTEPLTNSCWRVTCYANAKPVCSGCALVEW